MKKDAAVSSAEITPLSHRLGWRPSYGIMKEQQGSHATNCLKGRRAEQNPTAEKQSQENPSTKEDNLWAGNAAGSHQKSFEEVQHQFVPLIPGPTGQSSRISR